MLLNDTQIRALCQTDTPMISPFVDHKVSAIGDLKVISFGLDSAGYDIRLGNVFKIVRNGYMLDPKHADDTFYKTVDTYLENIIIPPNTTVLGHSVEAFNMPRNVKAFALGKSTYARVNVFPNITPLEAGWRGFLTIEIANLGHVPVKVYPGEGIASLSFFAIDTPEADYTQRGGKYNDQVGVTLSR